MTDGMTQGRRTPRPCRWALPWTLRLEPRLDRPRWLSPALTIGALVVALLISGLILA